MGPQVMLGWQRPERMRPIKDGWLHTGDIAVMDEGVPAHRRSQRYDPGVGFNSIRTKSKYWSCSECWKWRIGVPSGSSGEAVESVVKKDALTEEALITFCRRHLTGYKVPKLVEFRDELPKSGKILRELREARAKVDNKG